MKSVFEPVHEILILDLLVLVWVDNVHVSVEHLLGLLLHSFDVFVGFCELPDLDFLEVLAKGDELAVALKYAKILDLVLVAMVELGVLKVMVEEEKGLIIHNCNPAV